MSKELDQLAQIKTMMEKSSRFLSLSGLSGVAAGLIGVIGGVIAHFLISGHHHSEASYMARQSVQDSSDLTLQLFILAICTLTLALGFGLLFTMRKAKKEETKIWNSSSKRFAFHLFVPLSTGAVFIFLLIYHGIGFMVAPSMLIFYGLSLINAGKFTHDDIKQLGLLEIILGVLSAIFIGKGLLFWIIGFGLLHILYGIIMYVKYERK